MLVGRADERKIVMIGRVHAASAQVGSYVSLTIPSTETSVYSTSLRRVIAGGLRVVPGRFRDTP